MYFSDKKGLTDVNNNLEPMHLACMKNIDKWQAVIDENQKSIDLP